jgi:hypothetical protein
LIVQRNYTKYPQFGKIFFPKSSFELLDAQESEGEIFPSLQSLAQGLLEK